MGEAENAVLGPFEEMGNSVLAYLPTLVAGLLILLLGLAVCWLVKRVIARVVLLARIDRPLRNLRWARGLDHADVRHAVANTLGSVVAAIVFLVFLNSAVAVWRLAVLADLIGELVFYLPRLIVGLVVLLIGAVLSTTLSERVRTGLALEGFSRAGLVGRLARWALMAVVVAITLEEMGIAPRTVNSAFVISMATLGLLLALAVGLGSRRAVDRMWRSFLEEPHRSE